MRIAVLTPTFLPVVGGAEIVLYEVFRRLAVRHEIVLVTPHLSSDLINQYKNREADYPVPFRVVRYRDRYTFMNIRGHTILKGLIPPFSLSAVGALGRVCKEFKPDVVNVHYTMPTGLAGAIADKLWNIPAVLMLNGRDVPGPQVPPLWKQWHRLIGRLCSHVMYGSPYCRDAVFGSNGPGTIVWNGVDFSKIVIDDGKEFRLKHGISENAPLIFALQRLSREKRVDVLISAMEVIVRQNPDARLIIGGTGPLRDQLQQLIDSRGLNSRITLAGFIPDNDLSGYFNACDLFMFNSTYETFGIVIAQAMAHAKPVVSVVNTAIPGVAPHNECSLLVAQNNPAAMAAAALRLISDKPLRDQLGAAGRKRSLELFDWDIIAKKYEDVFDRVINR